MPDPVARPEKTPLIDVGIAARVASKLAAPGPLDRSYLLDGLEESISALVAEAEPLIAEQTGFAPPQPAVPVVLSRADWSVANIESMTALISPLLDRVSKRMGDRSVPLLMQLGYRAGLGAQLGAVLGFLSQRVLGQYDILKSHQNQVWFVGPNIVATEHRLGFVPRDFRLWIALHELTHRCQFEGNQWVRDHFLGLTGEMLESLDVDARTVLDRMLKSLKGGGDSEPMMIKLLNPAQLEIFNKLQAFMSVIEGHGNFVMDRVAEQTIPTARRMRAQLAGGAPSGPMAKLVGKLLGLDLKRAQYEQGQNFFNAVFAATGQSGVSSVFESAQALPTLEEVRAPELWLRRVAA
jgi:coenzyme F420 biosynthesis associated uncharacterized protein